MGKCVQTDVPDIFTASEKKAAEIDLSRCLQKGAGITKKSHHTVGEKEKRGSYITTRNKHFQSDVFLTRS